jgi:hypothetical protein
MIGDARVRERMAYFPATTRRMDDKRRRKIGVIVFI